MATASSGRSRRTASERRGRVAPCRTRRWSPRPGARVHAAGADARPACPWAPSLPMPVNTQATHRRRRRPRPWTSSIRSTDGAWSEAVVGLEHDAFVGTDGQLRAARAEQDDARFERVAVGGDPHIPAVVLRASERGRRPGAASMCCTHSTGTSSGAEVTEHAGRAPPGRRWTRRAHDCGEPGRRCGPRRSGGDRRARLTVAVRRRDASVRTRPGAAAGCGRPSGPASRAHRRRRPRAPPRPRPSGAARLTR